MSSLNIQGVLKNMKQTNKYDPIIEAIINSIDAINEKEEKNGEIEIIFKREKVLDGGKGFINSININDNGAGFNKKNLDSFDTLYSDWKSSKGGKGFGRFTYKKYFEKVEIQSFFIDELGTKKEIQFNFGDNEIVENKTISENSNISRTTICLKNYNNHKQPYEKELKTISRIILEKILIYFIKEENNFPKIILKDDTEKIILNGLYKNSEEIILDLENTFEIKKNNGEEEIKRNFELKVFKIFSPESQKSKIILTGDKREVIATNISDYISEFTNEFIEEREGKTKEKINKNYIFKAYVIGDYLDENVEVERNKFKFDKKEQTLQHIICQKEIEEKVCKILKEKYKNILKERTEKKIENITKIVDENFPYYKFFLKELDIDSIPVNPTNEQVALEIEKIKIKKEVVFKKKSKDILDDFVNSTKDKIKEVFDSLEETQKSELAHYISLRKVYIDFLKKALEKDEEGKYKKEEYLHEIIFPMKEDSESLLFGNHNLWLLDENLNFVDYINSDNTSIKNNKGRIDLLFVHENITFRETNDEAKPISIFEFKRPMRDDFFENSPLEQVEKYVQKLKENNIQTKKGRPILIGNNTPFYVYIIGDYNEKIKKFLFSKNFKQLPQEQKWRIYNENMNLFIEYISWEQLLKDAEQKNKRFFEKLGI